MPGSKKEILKKGGNPVTSGGIKYLIELNRKHSQLFAREHLIRRLYREKHPTEIAVLKCMDGRVHIPRMTNTPLGIIQPWRNLGGQFNLGWYGFDLAMREWVNYAIGEKRRCLILVTYHYSRGDVHRGCRGFNYDTIAAQKFTHSLRDQFDRVFPGREVVYTVQVGVETDFESLVLHGNNGETIDLSAIKKPTKERLLALLQQMYPDMPQEIIFDFLPLIEGNIAHVEDVRRDNKPIGDAEHKEWVLGIGRGFDWLHEINLALLIGPFDPNLPNAIEKAAAILKGNIDARRVKATQEKGIVLMSSGAYRGITEKTHAIEKAQFLSEFSHGIITERVPDILPLIQRLTVAVNLDTREFEILSRD